MPNTPMLDSLSQLGYLQIHARHISEYLDDVELIYERISKRSDLDIPTNREMLAVLRAVQLELRYHINLINMLSTWTAGIISRDREVDAKFNSIEKKLSQLSER